jgi:hypothetical protein
LSADDVPRSGEQVGSVDDDDIYTLKRRGVERPSHELEDILTGVTLRFAKERFEARKWESPLDKASVHVRNMSKRRSTGPNEESVTEDTQLSKQTDSQNKMDLDGANSDSEDTSDAEINSTAREFCSETKDTQTDDGNILKETSEAPSDKESGILRPTVSADDERSREILRPTIRHALSRLDGLLMALHHSRQACLRFRSEQVGSQTEAEDENENQNEVGPEGPLPSPLPSNVSSPPRSRSRGRPPKIPAIPNFFEDALEDPLEPRRKSNRGRKRKVHTPLEGESQHEMTARIARLQHRAIPSPSAETFKLAPLVKQRKRSRTPSNKSEALLGLRDWSEVLGVAAMIGFSPKIIRRATQRCANIFGEGMDMRFLVESAQPSEDDELKSYVPEQIPVIDDPNTLSSDNQSSGIRSSSSRRRRRQRPSRPNSEIGESEDGKISITSETTVLNGEYFCPHDKCVRHDQGFNRKGHLRGHLKRVHKQTGDEVNQSLKGSDEEMEGAVHVDRFLKHVRRRTGWRGIDGAPRKRKRKNAKVGDSTRAQTDEASDNEEVLRDLSEKRKKSSPDRMQEDSHDETVEGARDNSSREASGSESGNRCK